VIETIAEISVPPRDATVYAEGWQSWSPAGILRGDAASPQAPDERTQVMGWRPEKPVPAGVIQAEGLLALVEPGGGAHAWLALDPAREVPTLRVRALADRIIVSADGAVDELRADDLDAALAAVADRLSPGEAKPIPPGWCSWLFYFQNLTAGDVIENLDAAVRLELPIEIIQIDDGYETCVGDWLDVSERFGSVRDTAARITAEGKRAGIWTAPFLVGERSGLAAAHPDWLVDGANAGWNWNQRLRVLDVTQRAAADHLVSVYRALSEMGFDYHKLDFLYAGALVSLEAYREGLSLIREAVGADATLVGCGGPLLPSIGLVDAMRIGPDVLAEQPAAPQDLDHVIRATSGRAWMNGRLWVNDPDCLVARPAIEERDAWAAHLAGYGGLAFSSDRLAALDGHGLELTRLVLSSPPVPR
jgi:alpha-galactosidase